MFYLQNWAHLVIPSNHTCLFLFCCHASKSFYYQVVLFFLSKQVPTGKGRQLPHWGQAGLQGYHKPVWAHLSSINAEAILRWFNYIAPAEWRRLSVCFDSCQLTLNINKTICEVAPSPCPDEAHLTQVKLMWAALTHAGKMNACQSYVWHCFSLIFYNRT